MSTPEGRLCSDSRGRFWDGSSHCTGKPNLYTFYKHYLPASPLHPAAAEREGADLVGGQGHEFLWLGDLLWAEVGQRDQEQPQTLARHKSSPEYCPVSLERAPVFHHSHHHSPPLCVDRVGRRYSSLL